MKEMNQRFNELEEKIAHLENANQQMSELIYAQQKQLDRHISETLLRLEKMSAEQSYQANSLADEVPPHY